MIIAIDGPAGSGKSTIAREVAKRLGMRYLDTGAMYRTVTLLALEAGLVPDRIPEAAALAERTLFRLQERDNDLTRVFVGDREVTDDIRGRLVSQNVSAVSADPGVRAVLTKKQHDEAARGDVVLEGRDIGTVVVPEAELKVFLTASIEERARRRRSQLQAQGADQPIDQLMADIAARDAHDSGRAVAPLRKAEDAVEIDTTGMTIAEVVDAVAALAETRRAQIPGGGRGETAPTWPVSRLVRSPLDTLLWRVAYSFLPFFWRRVFRMTITGREHFPRTGAVLLASNHRSNLDPFFLGVAAPRQIHFMAKAELWKVGVLGKAIDALGAFPVNRGEADRAAVKRALEILEAGAVVGLFPEGHRQRHGGLGTINPGVSLFSLRKGVVTLPAVIQGSERILRGKRLRLPRVSVTFGPPLELPAEGTPRSERARLVSERLTEAYMAILASSEKS